MAGRDAGELGLTLQDLRGIVRRRISWFAIPTAVGILFGLGVALFWPAEYEAAATLLIEPQGVPQNLVATTVSADTESRYGQIKLQIMSRDNLSEIIDEYELYPELVGELPREEIVEHMREKISIEPLPPAIVDPRKPVEIESFKIAFRDRDPRRAAEVANRLTSDFRAENLRQRRGQAAGTSEFIDAELARADSERGRLAQELRAYREEHRGELPEDLIANQSRLERMEATHRDARAQLDLARQQVAEIRRQIREQRSAGADETANPVARKRALELQVHQYRAQGKTDKHPDIVIARAEIAELEAMLAEQLDTDAPLSPAEAVLRSELRNHEVRESVLREELGRLTELIAGLQARIAATPERAARVGDLEARIIAASDQIRELQSKKIAADLGTQVELVEKGEKFRVVDTAELPTSPVSPNRPLVGIVGTLLGLLAGGVALALREMSDQSFHTIRDLQEALGLPVLGAIPTIRLPADLARTRAKLRRALVVTGVLLGLLAGGSLLAYAYEQLGSELPAATPAPDARAGAPGDRGDV